MGVYGGGTQPNLDITRKVSIKLKLEDGSYVEHNYVKGNLDNLIHDILGYAVAKHGAMYVHDLLHDWENTFDND